MWSYHQSSGALYDAAGLHIATGYSGAPAGKNDPTKQDIPKVGPIPRGLYTIGVPFASATHGPFAIHLTPGPGNEMHGRDGFLCHGDSKEHPGAASEGCIILQRAIREQVWSSGDHRLRVVESAQ